MSDRTKDREIEVFISKEDYKAIIDQDIQYVRLGDLTFIRKERCVEMVEKYHEEKSAKSKVFECANCGNEVESSGIPNAVISGCRDNCQLECLHTRKVE